MDVLIVVLQAVLGIALWIGVTYVKKLPDRLHQEGVARYEHGLKKDLEAIKAALAQENDLARIRYQESQSRMAEEYIEFIEYFNRIWTDKELLKRIQSGQKKSKEFDQKMVSLGVRLFIFGSDEAVRDYLAFRSASQEEHQKNPKGVIQKFGALVLQMRRDLLHPDTKCTEDDLLGSFITDWKPSGSGT